jgi:LuxR family transcriptional regulator, maltose regulon positive regulatory protein
MELIREKITTPTDLPPVARRRLLDRLAEHLPCYGATVITGCAGTGKTVLAAEFAQHYGRRVAWYKVDAPEADLKLFLHYLVASIALPCPGFGRWTLAHLQRLAELGNPSALAEALAYCLQNQSSPLLFVLDDLHLLYDAPWLTPFLQRLLELLPEETHMLIAARSLPPAPLWRLRSKQRLRVIDEPTLLFTVSEIEELFVRSGLPLDSVAAAQWRTRGRAAALDTLARQAGQIALAA